MMYLFINKYYFQVCIIDDREDVWNFAPNLIHVKPYHFFRHTGDINAPPGLTKKDQDDKTGFQFVGDKVEGSVKNLKEELTLEDEDSSKSDEELPTEQAPKKSTSEEEVKKIIGEVATDLNLSEDDSDNNDSGKEEAAGDADLEESNEEDNNQSQREKEEPTKKQDSSDVTSTTPVTSSEPDPSKDEDKNSNAAPPAEAETIKVVSQTEEAGSSEASSSAEVQAEATSEKAEAVADAPDSTSNIEEQKKPEERKVIEVEDEDDYLLYLEQILHSIHDAFYSLHDDMVKRKDTTGVPDVKNVIPYVRKKVLKVRFNINMLQCKPSLQFNRRNCLQLQ